MVIPFAVRRASQEVAISEVVIEGHLWSSEQKIDEVAVGVERKSRVWLG
jgi:hypothetical protein